WTYEVFPGATQRIGDPIKDSNPLRNRDRHQFGTLIAIPRNPEAIIRRAAQINAAALLSTDSPIARAKGCPAVEPNIIEPKSPFSTNRPFERIHGQPQQPGCNREPCADQRG